MVVIVDETVHERRVKVDLPWHELNRIIQRAVGVQLGMTADDAEAWLDVSLTQVEEGSPSYRVNKWVAHVDATIPVDE